MMTGPLTGPQITKQKLMALFRNEGGGSVSLDGKEYKADPAGVIDIPEEYADTVASFGYVRFVEAEQPLQAEYVAQEHPIKKKK